MESGNGNYQREMPDEGHYVMYRLSFSPQCSLGPLLSVCFYYKDRNTLIEQLLCTKHLNRAFSRI